MTKRRKDLKVLVVDDHPDMRCMMRCILSEIGFEHISEATDGADALEKMQDFDPDLLITDLDMPVLNGEGLVKSIREDDKWSYLPIVVITGNPSWPDELKSMVNRVLRKPVSKQELLEVLNEVVTT